MSAVQNIFNNIKNLSSAPAVTFRKNGNWDTISWKIFGEQIGKTASALASLGIEKGKTVAIFANNCREWLVTDFATQSLGAVTVPIYATNNTEQTEFILNQAEVSVILVGDEEQLQVVKEIELGRNLERPIFILIAKETEAKAENLAEFDEFINRFEPREGFIETTSEDLATLIYTSGTTGVPKGVMLTHGNFAEVITAHKEYFNIKNLHGKKSLAFLPLSHVFERAWSSFVLSQGGEVAVLDDTKLITSALKEVKPWAMCAVPRVYEKVYQTVIKNIEGSSNIKKALFANALNVGKKYSEFVQQGKKPPLSLKLKKAFFQKLVFDKIKNQMGGNLQFMPVGGAMLKKEISEFFAYIGLPVIVGYGLTETTATVTAYPTKGFVHGSVGKALPGVEIRIGEQDEILVKYGGVMKGYYKNPGETALVFTEDGYFKTGDAGRIDEDGNLYIVDRIKDLMKTSNGKYIAPQTIEVPLQTHPDILQAMVVAEGRPYVTSVIVPDFESLTKEMAEFREYATLSIQEKMKLLSKDSIVEKFQKIINEIQKDHAGFEKIKKFRLLPEELTIEKGEITPTLKIKRKTVLEKFAHLIEEMYS